MRLCNPGFTLGGFNIVKKLILLSSASLIFPAAAFAQSIGTQDFEEEEIIVTGTRAQDVGGVTAPDTSKAKAVLTQEFLARQNPGQTVLDSINVIPGVSFQNNDAYGSSGGRSDPRLRLLAHQPDLRRHPAQRFRQLPDLLQPADRPRADRAGQRQPRNDRRRLADRLGRRRNGQSSDPPPVQGLRRAGAGSLGEFGFRRIFGMFDTGELRPSATRAFMAVSTALNDIPFNNFGKTNRQQYNGQD